MSEEWGPWVDGAAGLRVGMAVQVDTTDVWSGSTIIHECRVVRDDGKNFDVDPELPICGDWRLNRYRTRKPRGLTILERIAADPQPVKEDA